MQVPGSLVNELGLPHWVSVFGIDGLKEFEQRGADGKLRKIDLQNSLGIAEYLKSRVGQTVTVKYSLDLGARMQEKTFTVRADNVDPWQMRVLYVPDDLAFDVKSTLLSAGGNPVQALRMSMREVGGWIKQVYLSLHMLFVKRNVGVEHVHGPVGIFGAAIEQAKVGLTDLMYFLAFISVNLAVINFLPMPVMDGGLMLFLLIEKIKGKPLSIKTQMITTLIGLAAILLIGILVTIQDIGRLFS
jgi:regulator of sigma E protease